MKGKGLGVWAALLPSLPSVVPGVPLEVLPHSILGEREQLLKRWRKSKGRTWAPAAQQSSGMGVGG